MIEFLHRPICLPVAFALLLAGCEEEAAPPPPAAPEVTVVTLQTQTVSLTRQLPGRTSAFLMAEVRPRVTGIVEERLFTEGSLVEAGQPLYQLDDATYRADYNSAVASRKRAEATLEVARQNAERAAELVEADAVSRQEYDNAVAALRQAEADLAVAEAAVDSSRVRLDYARITSPISGRIGKSSVTPGALVTADQAQPLATVQQLDPIYVDLTQSSSELLQLRKSLAGGDVRGAEDTAVTILLEDGSRYKHEGELNFADVSVDPSTGSYSLRVTVPNPQHLLMPGMYVRAVLSSAILDDGLLVPQQGITRDPRGNANALVVREDGTVEQRSVEVSRTVGDQWLVNDGLQAGDRVIVEGLQKVQPGMPVDAGEAPASAANADRPAAPGQEAQGRQAGGPGTRH